MPIFCYAVDDYNSFPFFHIIFCASSTTKLLNRSSRVLSLRLIFSNFFYTFEVRPSPRDQIWPLIYNSFSASSLIPKSQLFKQVIQVCLSTWKIDIFFKLFWKFFQCWTLISAEIRMYSCSYYAQIKIVQLFELLDALFFICRTRSLLCIFILFNYSFY